MKHIYILLISIFTVALAGTVQGQSAVIYNVADSTVKIEESKYRFEDHEIYLKFYNGSNDAHQFWVRRTLNDTASGHESFFCDWDDCYTPMTSESKSSKYLNAGDTSKEYVQAYLRSNGVSGTSQIRWCLEDKQFFDDRTCVTFNYIVDFNVGISTVTSNSFPQFYPNPAQGAALVSLTGDFTQSQLELIDNSGRRVLRTKISAKNPGLNLQGLAQGTYRALFYGVNGAVHSTQLLVQ